MAFLNEDDELWRHIEWLAIMVGMTVYDIERHGRGKIIVSIQKGSESIPDCMNGPGVTSDDCSFFVRELQAYFEREGEALGLPPEPEIEVCSPGVNRKLRLPKHYAYAVGERVKAIILPDKKLLLGTLVYADEGEACIADEQSKAEVRFALKDVKSAAVDFKFD